MLRQLKVLLIEDDDSDAELFVRQIRGANHREIEVRHEASITAGIAALAEFWPDCVITDLSLSDSVGVSTVERVARACEGAAIVVLTGALDDALVSSAMKAGAHGYIVKGEAKGGLIVRTVLFAIERMQVERELDSAESNLHKLMANSKDGMLLVDSDGTIQFENPAANHLLSARGVRNVGKRLKLRFDPEAMQENRIVREDESVLIVETRATPFDWNGESVYLVSLQDITQRREMEKRARQSEQRYRQLFEEMMPAFALDEVVLDAAGRPCDLRILEVNPMFEQIVGRSRQEVVGHTVRELFPIEDDFWLDYCSRVALSGEPEHCEHYAMGIDKYIEASAFSPQRGMVAVTFMDVTARKKAEEELLLLAAAVSNAGEAISLLDNVGRVIYVNPAFGKTFGLEPKAIVGMPSPILAAIQSNLGAYGSLLRAIEDGITCSGRFQVERPDGTRRELDTTISPIRDNKGQVSHFAVISRDVTDRLLAETQLRQAQKLEAIGTLAGGIAHDFNNILAAIMGYTELAAQTLPQEHEVQEDLLRVLTAGQRAQSLIQQILMFSRQRELEHQPLRVDIAIKEALKLLRATLPATIEIRTTYTEGSFKILGDLTQVQQVLMNLCTNAFHAMPDGGVLEVRLESITLDDLSSKAAAELRAGNYIRLTVSDTGHGMDKRTLERIFEPFFTTKEAGKGTGLGLATVHGIVKAHNGAITVYSEPGQGTTFHAYFPVASAELVPPEPLDSASPMLRGNGEHVLVVDDEPSLANLGKTMLERLGYRATAFTSALDALEAFAAAPNAFQAVLSDHTMPKMNGMTLAKKIKELRQEIPVVLCTGFSEALTEDRDSNTKPSEVLRKPILMGELAKAIHRALL
jgi:PAS domain S-box-containing protein